MKREYLIAIGAWGVALLVSVFLVRQFLPELFGRPMDLEVVQLKEEKAPFLEVAFRREELAQADMLVQDPLLVVRGKPLLPALHGVGPHDLLGFRNHSVPRVADVVTIGDSQTYGMNVVRAQSWPGVVEEQLRVTVYNMSVGGWGAVQYLSVAEKALALSPRALVLAIYLGNDALESYRTAYSVSYWKSLRPDPELDLSVFPAVSFPPPEESWFRFHRKDGSEMIFTPELRFASNDPKSKAVEVGYQIIESVIRMVAKRAAAQGTEFFLALIPSKERVYEKVVFDSEQVAPESYRRLIDSERFWYEKLRIVASTSGATFIDLVPLLQSAALNEPYLYPPDRDGHPLAAGYRVIGGAIAWRLAKKVKALSDGVYAVAVSETEEWVYVKRGESCVQYSSRAVYRREVGEEGREPRAVGLQEIVGCRLEGFVR